MNGATINKIEYFSVHIVLDGSIKASGHSGSTERDHAHVFLDVPPDRRMEVIAALEEAAGKLRALEGG